MTPPALAHNAMGPLKLNQMSFITSLENGSSKLIELIWLIWTSPRCELSTGFILAIITDQYIFFEVKAGHNTTVEIVKPHFIAILMMITMRESKISFP